MSQLTHRDVKTLGLSALGGVLEFYDFIIFVFFTKIIAQLFFPPDIPDWLRQLETYAIFAAGYLARPLGGIIMAHFGDMMGRKKMFTLSIFLMAIPTLAIGLMPTYATIGIWAPIFMLLCRIMQGAAIGGEAPGAWVFVAEHVAPRHISFACALLTSGLTGGILLGAVVAAAVNASFQPNELLDYGWRLPFILGGIFGMISVWLRRWLHETPVFQELQSKRAISEEIPLKTVLKSHRSAVILTMLLTWQLSAAIVTMILMTPALLQSLHVTDAKLALEANIIATLTLTIGCVFFGALAGKFGAGRLLFIGSLGLAVTSIYFYRQRLVSTEQIFILYGLCGFFVGVIGTMPAVCVMAFPASIRFTGLSFSYNIAYAVFGGLTPVLVSLLLPFNHMAPAYYVAALSVLGMLIAVHLMSNRVKTSV